MPYDFRIHGQMSLETRQAYQAGLQLNQDLTNLMSDTSINLNTDSLTKANKQVLELQSNLRSALNPSRGTIDLAMLSQQLDRSGTSLTQYAQTLTKYGKDGQQAFLSLTKSIASAEAPTTRLSQGLKDAGEQLKRTIGWQLSSSAIHGVMSTYSQAIGYAKELNRSLTDIRIVTGQSQAQMANFAKYANVAAKNLSSTTTRYTDAALIYYQQGLSEKQVKDRTDVTIKMANVAGVSAEKASQQLTSIWNNFYDGSKSLEHYADVMVKLGAETASSSEEISKGIQKFAAIGNTVGLSYEYAASALATVTATTRESADTVGTSFRTLFSRLQGLSLGQTLEDGTTLNKYSKALDTIGVRIKETNGEMKAMDTILDEIGAKWKTLSKDTQIGLAQSVGGARQYASFMALMDNWDYFQENVNRANSASGALQQQQEIYAESWAAASRQVQASMENIFNSVVNDKFVIGATKSFATILDSVGGLTKGLGGLDSIMTTVGRFALNKYAKEFPRMLEDLRYNTSYMFNGKTGTIDQRQETIFKDANTGILNLANANGMGVSFAKNDLGQVTGIDWENAQNAYGYDPVFATQLKNASLQLDRRQQYLQVEKTLSEREKQQYQQTLQAAQLWDDKAIDQARIVKYSTEQLKSTQKDIGQEQYNELIDDIKQYRRDFVGTDGKVSTYNLRDDLSRQQYYNARINSLEAKREAEISKIQNTSPVNADKLIRNVNNIYNKQIKDLQAESISIKDGLVESVGEKIKLPSSTDNVDSYTNAILRTIKNNPELSNNFTSDFNNVIQKMQSGQQITLSDKNILQQGLEVIQQPLVDISKSFGSLSYQTNKLTDNLNKNNTSVMNSTQATARFSKTSTDITTSWKNMTKQYLNAVGKENMFKVGGIGNTEFKEARNAYQQLQNALKGGASESEIYKLTKTFETKAAAMTDVVEKAAWEKGLTDEQTAAIRQRAEENNRTFEQQKEIERQQDKLTRQQLKHVQSKEERAAEVLKIGMSLYGAYQGAQGMWDTLANKDARASDKVGSVIGAGMQAFMLNNALSGSKGLANIVAGAGSKIGGLIGGGLGSSIVGATAATAAGGPPAWATMLITGLVTMMPVLTNKLDDAIETTSEREERIKQGNEALEQQVKIAQQKQSVFDQTSANYQQSLLTYHNTELGSIENIRALGQVNDTGLSIIRDNNLTYDDYIITDDGLVQVKNESLKQIEQQLAENVLKYQAQSAIADLNSLATGRVSERDYYNQLTMNEINRSEDAKAVAEAELAQAKLDLQNGDEDAQNRIDILSQGIAQRELENSQILARFNTALYAAASADGYYDRSDSAAVKSVLQTVSVEGIEQISQQLEGLYDFNPNNVTTQDLVDNALLNNVMTVEDMNTLLNSDDYLTAAANSAEEGKKYLMNAIKHQAYLNEYDKLIYEEKKEQKQLDSRYNKEALNDKNMGELRALISEGGHLYNNANSTLSKEYKFALAQYNQTATDFYKALGEYLPDISFEGALEQFTLYEAEVLSETLQEFGDTFGNEAAKSIYSATLKASGEDREVLLNTLKSVDFSGSAIQSLGQIYELSEEFGGQYTELFEDIRKSFGGDVGIFKTLTSDKAIQKLVNNFESFGDIDAEAIMKASHSSSDLALALELANFNAGGLAAALEGIASRTINEKQVSNSLLAGLSTLNQIDTARGYAFDSVDNYDKGRAVTDLTKFTGNLAKTIHYNIRNGLMFDEPLMNAWGELLGANKKNELKQDFINAGSVNKEDISKMFNTKYKAEKKMLEAMQKNPYDFNPLWEYALDTSQVKENERYNDEWVQVDDEKEDTKNASYNSISEEEWNSFKQYATQNKDGSWAVNEGVTGVAKEFADTIATKVNKENEYKNKYVNIDGAVYKIGSGERDVHWDAKAEKWVGADGGKVNNSNALFGYSPSKKGVIFTDYFDQQNMDYEELKNIMQLNLGLSENTADRMIAEAAAQNTSLQKTLDQNGIDNAVSDMVNAAIENDEYITADQMEVMYQSSEYLQDKYQGAGSKGWMLDYLTGADLEAPDKTKYKTNEEYKNAVLNYNNELNNRALFKERYIDFSGATSNSYEDMNAALEKNTGYSIEDRLKKNGKTVNTAIYGEKTDPWNGEKTTDYSNITGYQEKTGFDLSDNFNQLLAMGLSEEAAYDALTKTMQETGSVLIESIRGVDGSIQTFSTDSAKFQQWSQEHGMDVEEADAEAFAQFISEEEAVAKAVQQMAIDAKARAEYEKTHNADGSLKTQEEIAADAGEVNGDVATDENGNPLIDTDGDGTPDSTATEAEIPTSQPAASGDDGGSSPGSGPQTSTDYGGLTKEQYEIVMGDNVDIKDGQFVVTGDAAYKPGSGMTGSEWREQNKNTLDAIDAANKASDAAAKAAEKNAALAGKLTGKAVGQNQHKITKHYASGRNNDDYEGLAQVGELGPELSIDKDGNATMLGVNGPTYAYVEKDDIIFTAEQTKDILRTTPDLNNVPGFSISKGIDGATTGTSSLYINDNIWDGYGNSGSSGDGGGEDDDWEPDRYVTIMEQLQDLQREYARLIKAKERAFGADKIKALDAEIAKTNELISAQKQYIKEISAYKEKDIAKLKELGVTDLQFDKNGVIRNFEEVQEKYKKAAEEGDETATKQYEAILKYMETNNLLEQQMDSLIDMQWQLMDARIERITTKVDIKVAVDDTDLQYLSYQLGKIHDEAYDVAKALSLIGESMGVNLNKINAYRQGLGETLQEAFTEIGLDEKAQKELLDKIEQGTLTQEDLDNFEISPDHSQNIMNVLLDYRQQLITVNQQLDQLRDQVTDLVVRHFTDFTKDIGKQTSLINTYTNTLQTYANLTELLNGRFQGNMDKVLADINSSISKNAKDSIKNTELMVQAAELKYEELNKMYLAAQELGDQATMDKVADARDTAYKELQEANNKYASAWLSANEAFLNEFKFGVNKAIENFQEQLSPLFGTVEALSAAFERQNSLNDQYVDDYEKYYELNKLNRDLQTAIDETDNVNSKKALAKLQAEINKEKASENKLSEYDLEVLKNKVELEKARLALDEAKNAKSTVTLSRDQNGNWGYIYTAEEDKVAQAEQDYEDKLYEYQKANKEYLDDLQAMSIEAYTNMVEAISALDVNDPHYKEQQKSIVDSYMQTVAYIQEQMTSALGNQEDSRLVALERYDISMINLKNDFEDLSLSFITGEKNLENYFATLETAMPTLLAQLNELENKYETNITDINNYVTGNKNIADYMNENMDILVNKSEEANQKIQGLYDTMVDELADVNKEVIDIYNNWLPHIMEITEKNEILAESISKIQHELSDLSEVEVPPVLQPNEWDHPEGYTENDYGVIRKLTEEELKLKDEIAKEIQTDKNKLITNYDELKEKWYEEPPAEGEEDKRDADKKAKWDLLEKLINAGVYNIGNPTGTKIGLTSVWQEILSSNANAMSNGANTVSQKVFEPGMVIEQRVSIEAHFPGVNNRFEIEEALNDLNNRAAQYAYRKR